MELKRQQSQMCTSVTSSPDQSTRNKQLKLMPSRPDVTEMKQLEDFKKQEEETDGKLKEKPKTPIGATALADISNVVDFSQRQKTNSMTSYDLSDSDRVSESFYLHRQQLMSVRLDLSFMTSPAMEAARTMVPKETKNSEDILILAAKLFTFQHKCNPKAKQLVSLLIDCDFDEEEIIEMFAKLRKDCQDDREEELFESSTNSSPSSRVDINVQEEIGEDIPPSFPSVYIPVETNSQSQSSTNLPSLPAMVGLPSLPVNDLSNIPIRTVEPSPLALLSDIAPTPPTITNPTCLPTAVLDSLSEEPRLSTVAAVLTREHQLLVEGTKCVTCKVRDREVTFLPCGHFSLCSTCSELTNVCPICQTKALAEVKTFLS